MGLAVLLILGQSSLSPKTTAVSSTSMKPGLRLDVKSTTVFIPKFDSGRAIQVAKETLTFFGAKDLKLSGFRLEADTSSPSPLPHWYIAFKASNQGKAYLQAHIDAMDGRVLRAEFTDYPNSINHGPGPRHADAEEFAWKIVKKTGDHRPLQLKSCIVGEPLTEAAFDILLDDQHFFNVFPSYGYTMQFDLKTRRVYTVRSFGVLPPVDKRPTKISKSEAKEILTKAFPSSPEFKRRVDIQKIFGQLTFRVRMELGFYKRRGETSARHVWRGEATIVRKDGKPPYDLSKEYLMADAVTGEVIPIVNQDAEVNR